MNRTVVAALGSTAVLVVGGIGLVALAPATAGQGDPHHQRFTLIAQDSEATLTPADFGTKPVPNQQGAEDAPVYRDGHRVGRAETIITITRVVGDDVASMIECSLELPDGTILFNGAFHQGQLAKGAAVPVVGGTGHYAGLRGTVVMSMPSAAATQLVFDVTTK